ncbi:hypothetical protein CEXT_451141 [Caerostris extrusa]|uniref:Secreted protein n=1 Tax=Caerostris extrusa TaxID=172846 RepID=A0AAV4Y5U4_CAEEX|nr:hypothetical protein CEXT_451141 [Caerostris extrusa]
MLSSLLCTLCQCAQCTLNRVPSFACAFFLFSSNISLNTLCKSIPCYSPFCAHSLCDSASKKQCSLAGVRKAPLQLPALGRLGKTLISWRGGQLILTETPKWSEGLTASRGDFLFFSFCMEM